MKFVQTGSSCLEEKVACGVLLFVESCVVRLKDSMLSASTASWGRVFQILIAQEKKVV